MKDKQGMEALIKKEILTVPYLNGLREGLKINKNFTYEQKQFYYNLIDRKINSLNRQEMA